MGSSPGAELFRNQEDLIRMFTDAFYEHVGPTTASPRDSGLFCLLLLLERHFCTPSSQRDRPQAGDFNQISFYGVVLIRAMSAYVFSKRKCEARMSECLKKRTHRCKPF